MPTITASITTRTTQPRPSLPIVVSPFGRAGLYREPSGSRPEAGENLGRKQRLEPPDSSRLPDDARHPGLSKWDLALLVAEDEQAHERAEQRLVSHEEQRALPGARQNRGHVGGSVKRLESRRDRYLADVERAGGGLGGLERSPIGRGQHGFDARIEGCQPGRDLAGAPDAVGGQ